MSHTKVEHPPTLRARVRDATVDALLDTAEGLIVQKGLEQTTMQQIAVEAGCATGTLYLYFKNKEELFHAMLGRHARTMFSPALLALKREGDPLNRILAGTRVLVGYILGRRDFFRVVFRELCMRTKMMEQCLGEEASSEQDRYHAELLVLIKEAQKKGLIRKDVDAVKLFEFMDTVGMALCEDAVEQEVLPNVEEQVGLMWGLMSNGIGVKEGKR